MDFGQKEDLFIEEGAEIEFATLNCKTGKIYIGKNAEIMEGSVVRGSLALCEGSKINMGSKIYGATTINMHILKLAAKSIILLSLVLPIKVTKVLWKFCDWRMVQLGSRHQFFF